MVSSITNRVILAAWRSSIVWLAQSFPMWVSSCHRQSCSIEHPAERGGHRNIKIFSTTKSKFGGTQTVHYYWSMHFPYNRNTVDSKSRARQWLALFFGGERLRLAFKPWVPDDVDDGDIIWDEEEAPPVDMRCMLSIPESSGKVSFRMAGGENNMDASVVPTRLLLGVSGAEKLSSIMGGAQLDAKLFRTLLLLPQLIPVVLSVGE